MIAIVNNLPLQHMLVQRKDAGRGKIFYGNLFANKLSQEAHTGRRLNMIDRFGAFRRFLVLWKRNMLN
jgi:hypothetical protein